MVIKIKNNINFVNNDYKTLITLNLIFVIEEDIYEDAEEEYEGGEEYDEEVGAGDAPCILQTGIYFICVNLILAKLGYLQCI